MADVRKDTATPEIMGPEEALARIMGEMLEPAGDKLLTVTDVTPREVFDLSHLLAYGKVFKSKVVEDWVRNFLLLRISRLRIGRREFVVFGTGVREMAEEKRRKGGPKDLSAGLR